MTDRVKLMGLDFGTTTSSAVVADATLLRSATGRVELDVPVERFRSDMVFTPMLGDDRVDLDSINRLLDAWLTAGQVRPGELFGGGALLTGLTAQKDNTAGLVGLIRRRLGDALVATADDPCLESWLSFLGNCTHLSRQHPDRTILNLDIGGGTTNLALGQNRQVSRTGCLFIGARHVQVSPGTYRITKLSPYAIDVFNHLGIAKKPGDELTASELAGFVNFCVATLEDIFTGKQNHAAEIMNRLEQVRFRLPADMPPPIVTFSGGVGELVYRHLRGEPWPTTTCFGDLGIDLAQRIAGSPIWEDSLRRYRPESGGRATVFGLLRHTTEVSGSTLFLRTPGILPLADVPILGSVSSSDSDEPLRGLFGLVKRSHRGGCVQVRVGSQQAAVVADFGRRLASLLEEIAFPANQPLVLLVKENVGKVLGQYATRWGALPLQLLVIDEVTLRDAQYVQIGSPRHHIVPVSFYGIGPERIES